MEDSEVVISTPFVGHETDLKELGANCIKTDVDRRSINPFTDLKLLRTYKTILKQEKPDLVITYSIKPNIYAGYLCGKMKIPFCANVQGLGTAFQKALLSNLVTVMYRTAFRKVETVFFENQADANVFTDNRLIELNQTCVLHGAGVNLERYSYQEYPQDDVIHFIFVGRIMKEKGIDELFYTAKKMKELYGKKVIFDLVGFFEDEYKDAVNELNEQGIISYHGFQEDVRPFLTKSHCLLLPSYHEGMANTILEASAMGRPVIVSDISGCKEGVIEDKSGYLVEVKNSQSLFEKVEQFYRLPADEKEKMGLTARRFMEKEFDKTAVVETTYKELML